MTPTLLVIPSLLPFLLRRTCHCRPASEAFLAALAAMTMLVQRLLM
jgi:hypothetical protein